MLDYQPLFGKPDPWERRKSSLAFEQPALFFVCLEIHRNSFVNQLIFFIIAYYRHPS